MIKPRYTLALALAAALAAGLSGCGTKGNVVRADRYDAETIVDLMNDDAPVVNGNAPNHTQHPGKKDDVTHSPLDGEWVIVSAGNKAIKLDDDMPYIIFSDRDGRFYASNGCNVINGAFDYSSGQTLRFDDVVSSRMSCPDVKFQRDISSVLNNGVVVKTKIENKHRETYLYLMSNSNDHLLTLRRHNLEVINGLWEVTDIGSEKVSSDQINIFFDIPERLVHGNTGCNYFNGTINIDHDRSSHISFSQMGVTMRYCDNADIERHMLVALEETEGYNLKGHDTLYLLDSKGHHLMTLHRLPIE